MEYNSFFGGRQGASFVIVKRYLSIAEMISKFQQGSNYTEVHFDEYVLIDTEAANDKDNGKLFRRGYTYTDDMRRRRICRSNSWTCGICTSIRSHKI